MIRQTHADRAAWKKHLGNWRLYAAASGASVAAGTSADAGIVYSGTLNVKAQVTGNTGYNTAGFALAGHQLAVGVNKLTAQTGSPGSTSFFFYGKAFLKIPSAGNLFGFRNSSTGVGLRNFAQGQAIVAPASNTYKTRGDAVLRSRLSTGYVYGNFPANGAGFVGFSMSGGKLGWIKLSLTTDGNGIPSSVTVLGWAYNDVVGDPINAGQTTNAVPEPGTMAMGLLASGAAGLVALRKAKKRAQDEQAAA